MYFEYGDKETEYLKRKDKWLGEAVDAIGHIEREVGGEPLTELGYIFDSEVWDNGYATESAETLIELAFEQYGVDCLYCTIRPNSTASIRVAERIGFKQTGSYAKIYQGQEMPHLIYTLTCQEE